MGHKLNFDGIKSEEKSMEEHPDDKFRRLEWGFDDDLTLDALIEALEDVIQKMEENSNNGK